MGSYSLSSSTALNFLVFLLYRKSYTHLVKSNMKRNLFSGKNTIIVPLFSPHSYFDFYFLIFRI